MYLLDIVYVNTQYHEKSDEQKLKVVCFLRAAHIFWSWSNSFHWRASEACKTLSGLNDGNRRYIYVYIYVYIYICIYL